MSKANLKALPQPEEAEETFDESEYPAEIKLINRTWQWALIRRPGARSRMRFAGHIGNGIPPEEAIRKILKLDVPFEKQKVPDGVTQFVWESFWGPTGRGGKGIEEKAVTWQKDPAVKAEMKAQTALAQSRIESMSDLAVQTLGNVMTSVSANENARVNAAKEVLNRSGLTGGGQQKSSELRELARALAEAQRPSSEKKKKGPEPDAD